MQTFDRAGRRRRVALLVSLAISAGTAFHARSAWAKDDGASADSPLLACKAVADDAARLRCFDAVAASVPATPAPDLPKGPAKGDVLRLPNVAESAPPLARARPTRHSVRLELGYGLSIGDYSGSSEVARHGTLVSQSGTGGSGGGVLAEAWLDNWPRRDLSVGLGYVEIGNNATIVANLPEGASILTDPIHAEISGTVRAKLVMINLAYRPPAYGRVRPIVGFGLGGGPATAQGFEEFENAFIGNGSARQQTHSPVPALQVYTGIQVDLTRHLYLDIVPRLLWVGVAPFGNGLHYTDFILGTNIGYRF